MKHVSKLAPHVDPEAPEMNFRFGDGQHPMFKQWRKMVLSAIDMTHKAYPAIGAKQITVCDRWMSFANFKSDMESTFEDEPSKPATLRKNYLARINLKAGFNPKNCVWLPKAQAVAVQSKTVLVDTCHGRGMTLKALAQYLSDHAGEDLPKGAEIYKVWVWDMNTDTLKMEKVQIEVETIQPIKFLELRRRYQQGLPLLAPVRVKQDETAACDSYHEGELVKDRKPFVPPTISEGESHELFGEVRNKTEFKDTVLPTL